MSDLAREKALRPIYTHLDTFNYSKALKLTYAKPQCDWPITIALRAHCLERSGRKLDSCREIRILVSALSKSNGSGSGSNSNGDGDEWSELDGTIWMLGLGSEGEQSTVGTNQTSASETMAASSSSGNTGSSSSKGKGKKGKGKSSSAKASSNSNSGNSGATTQTKSVTKSPLDMIHVLDLPKYKLQQILSSSKFVEHSFMLDKIPFQPIQIVDEVSLKNNATI